jgi:hypothetical protein
VTNNNLREGLKMAVAKSFDPSTKLAKCSCRSKYQDETYGEDTRLMNKKKNGSWCCTVCGKDK